MVRDAAGTEGIKTAKKGKKPKAAKPGKVKKPKAAKPGKVAKPEDKLKTTPPPAGDPRLPVVGNDWRGAVSSPKKKPKKEEDEEEEDEEDKDEEDKDEEEEEEEKEEEGKKKEPALHKQVEVRPTYFRQFDNVLIPIVKLHNKCATFVGALVAADTKIKAAGAPSAISITLKGSTPREVSSTGYQHIEMMVMGQDKTITHAAAVEIKVRGATMEELANRADLAPHFEQLKLAKQWIDFHMAKAENRPDFKFWPYSLALQNGVLVACKLPLIWQEGAKIGMMDKGKMLMKLPRGMGHVSGELTNAVSEYNKAVAAIQIALTAGRTVTGSIADAKKWLADNGKGEVNLEVKINGIPLNLSGLRKVFGDAAGVTEFKAKGKAAATVAKEELVDDVKEKKGLSLPKIPKIEDFMPDGVADLTSMFEGEEGELPMITVQMVGDAAAKLKDKDVPSWVRNTLTLASKAGIKEAMNVLKAIKRIVVPNDDDMEGDIKFQDEGEGNVDWEVRGSRVPNLPLPPPRRPKSTHLSPPPRPPSGVDRQRHRGGEWHFV